MKKTVLITGAFLLLIAGVIFIGCSSSDNPTTNNNGSQDITLARVYPNDGSTGVVPSTEISMRFSGPMDTISVDHNFHLAGGPAMMEWRDSLENYGGFGMMGMGMQNHMMDWMENIHTPGEFHWNDSQDSCDFIPDSDLMHDADYICLFYEDGMQGHGGGMMGGMMGGATSGGSGYEMTGFTTGH
jgi:hypothetical protein